MGRLPNSQGCISTQRPHRRRLQPRRPLVPHVHLAGPASGADVPAVRGQAGVERHPLGRRLPHCVLESQINPARARDRAERGRVARLTSASECSPSGSPSQATRTGPERAPFARGDGSGACLRRKATSVPSTCTTGSAKPNRSIASRTLTQGTGLLKSCQTSQPPGVRASYALRLSFRTCSRSCPPSMNAKSSGASRPKS